MSYEFLAIVLLVVGCGLIVAEVFIPSGGMILVLCVVTFVASIWCAYKAWWGVSTAYFTTYVAGLLLLIPALLAGIYKLLNDTRVGDRILLAAPDLEEVTPYQHELARLEQLVGHAGTAVTPLSPGGMVNVSGERLHAFTEGILVEQGADVEVIAVRGNRVLVRPRSVSSANHVVATTDSNPIPAERIAPAPPPPLDFDVPQS
jgi:membrane-bound serine protease (ClpP class)